MKDIIAACTFFTRLPFWRLCNIPSDSFKRIVIHWPLAGWITGGVMVGIFWSASHIFSSAIIAVLLAFSSRLLLTGALHEDGLADFFDGMGGGNTKERVLSIMKDSSIGSYGVLALILYVALWTISVYTLTTHYALYSCCILLFFGDIWNKWTASQLINLLPYVRKVSESKNKLVYERMSFLQFLIGLIWVAFPFFCIFMFSTAFDEISLILLVSCIVPIITLVMLATYMKQRIKGYTGDCCGATFLLCELLYLLTLNGLWKFI